MIGEQTHREAWSGLVNTDRDERYLTLFSNRMRRLHKVTSIAVALGSTAAFASFAVDVSGMMDGAWSRVIGSAISLAVAGVAIWAMFSDFSKKAVVAANLADECRKTAAAWRELWVTLSGLDDAEARRRVRNLERRACEITKDVPHSLGIHNRLRDKSTDQADNLIRYEYPEAA